MNNAGTAYDLTHYLLSLGHHDIAFVGGIPGLTAAEQRISGYYAAMIENGLTPRKPMENGMSQESGRDAMGQLLAGSALPDAVTCTNDEVRLEYWPTCGGAAYACPMTFLVAGIGGTRVASTFDLTTMTLPLMDLGRLAARHIAATETEAETDAPDSPPYTLRVGTSTAPRGYRSSRSYTGERR